MMKRWLSALMAALLVVTLAGCSDAQKDQLAQVAVGVISEAANQLVENSQNNKPEAQTPETPEEPESPEETPDAEPPEAEQPETPDSPETSEEPGLLDEHGVYDSKEDVALYIYQYGHLPENYISKKDAEKLGWSGGSLEKYAPGKCIGGSRFGNYEELLPTQKGRSYTECDIDTLGASGRGAKRIVFSNDGLIYYTGDHYKTFELLYGEE